MQRQFEGAARGRHSKKVLVAHGDPFSGRIRGKALRPGRYQAVFTAAHSAGVSPPKTLSFIVRR